MLTAHNCGANFAHESAQEEPMDALELLKQDHQKVKKLLTSAT
jgi:hypothetical protein